MFSAVLDTSVLWPSLQRDFLLSLAAERCYAPRWSTAILDELAFHEARKLTERGKSENEAQQAAEHLITQMSTAFDDALVTGWEPLEGTFGLPDAGDEHVVAAAVVSGAEVIVTQNLKHFPAGKLPAPIRAIPARDFAYNTVRAHLAQSCRAITEICDRSGRHGPKITTTELLTILDERYQMPQAVELLSKALGLHEELN